MSKNFEFDDDPVLYTTGAYIKPLKVANPDGSEVWFWVVTQFEDDTFLDGEVFNPAENGYSRQELLVTDS